MKTNAKIYVMKADDGTLKLGHSIDPARRSKSVGRSVAVVYETAVVEQAERIERLAHKVLALHGKHLRGEWFEATLDDAILSIEIAIRQAEQQEFELGGRLNPSKPPVAPVQLYRFEMRVDDEFLEEVAFIQSTLRPVPNKSDAIREAVRVYADAIRRKAAKRKEGTGS